MNTTGAKNQRLFGTSGIRGPIDRISPNMALDLGRSLGTTLKEGDQVAIGTDARTSRSCLLHAFKAGLISTGIDVIDLGIAAMPVVAYSSLLSSITASVIVTASHNPPTDNGFKFFKEGREFVRSEANTIEEIITRHVFRVTDWSAIGKMTRYNIQSDYLNRAKKYLLSRGRHGEGMRVLVDAANGAACNYTPRLLTEIGFSVVTLNSHPDGHFPGRLPEPSPSNLRSTMNITAKLDLAVGVCHDGDGDRLAVIDEEGQFIDQNRVIALFAADEIERRGRGTIVVSIDTSSVIDEIVKQKGGEIIRVPLGMLQEELVRDTENKVLFASEPWKPIFPAYGGWMDGWLGACRFAQLVNETGDGSCIRLMRTIPEYPILREQIDCPDSLKQEFIRRVAELLLAEVSGIEKVNDMDGIRIDRVDGSYLLIRVSGTEPKARLYAGAKTWTTLNALAETARDIMKRALTEKVGK